MEEKDKKVESNNVDIDLLSTILTDSEINKQELNKKPNLSQDKSSIIYDINIKWVDDLIWILQKNEYDFLVVEPLEDYVKISFKKDWILKDEKIIKFPTYTFLLQNIKKITNLKLDVSNEEQKWTWNYVYKTSNIELLWKTVPTRFWENIFLKLRVPEWQKVIAKKWSTVSIWAAFSFIGALLLIWLILWSVFISFIILNANTIQDIDFFINLWISLNDINYFLAQLTTIIFSVLILIETIILIIFLFKALLTKKDLKRKKTIFTIFSILILIVTFATATFWLKLDKSIKNLPNWADIAKWDIQIFDNDLFNSEKFGKENSLINDYNNIIWPIDIKFDVKNLKESERKKWFNIEKYIWEFSGWDKLETSSSDIVKKFDKKWIINVKLTIEWIDSRTWKTVQKETIKIPNLNINYAVVKSEKVLNNWGKVVEFDASTLKELWEVEWFLESNPNVPIYTWPIFKPSKVYFEEELVWMKIKNPNKKNDSMDKLFLVSWKEAVIKWEIDAVASFDNPLVYTLKVKNINNNFWNWFIERFKWEVWWKEQNKTADVLNIEESSTITASLPSYWKNVIKVTLYDSNWKSTQIIKEVNISQALKVDNKLAIYDENDVYITDFFDEKTWDYKVNIPTPSKLRIDAKDIRTSNPLYKLNNVKWDVSSDGSYEWKWLSFENIFETSWTDNILVEYEFVHRKNKEDLAIIKQTIIVNWEEKDSQIKLDASISSEYAPATVQFDASNSKVKDDNIIKFIYDYWDGISEERDAKNSAHKYLKAWNYNVKLKVITEKWKEYSVSKLIILKEPPTSVSITSSMSKAPVWQYISFYSTSSQWQAVSYKWDFWDWETSTDPNPDHLFSKPWKYKVKLTVDFSNNNSISEDIEIEITN